VNEKNTKGIVRVSSFDVTATFDIRPDTDDAIVVDEVWNENVYRLGPDELNGVVVLDIGANCGAFSLFAEACGAKVLAYEPHPGNSAQLRKNIALNNSDVQPILAAIAASDGSAKLSEHIQNGTHVCTGSSKIAEEGFEVVAMSLATAIAMANSDRVIIKMDIEGGEYVAFDAVDVNDLANVERIVMEFHGEGTNWKDDTEAFGRLVCKLAEWGHVETLGRPSVGGMVYGKRYS